MCYSGLYSYGKVTDLGYNKQRLYGKACCKTCVLLVFRVEVRFKGERVRRRQWRGTGNKDDLFCYSTIYIKESRSLFGVFPSFVCISLSAYCFALAFDGNCCQMVV